MFLIILNWIDAMSLFSKRINILIKGDYSLMFN